MKGSKPQILKGFRDFLPQEAALKQKVTEILKRTFEMFGFQPLQTPTLEYASTLLGKYGKEADKLIYLFKDRGGREVGLRYDLTVPVCRVLATYQNQLPLPFKRYQIQNVFRAEKPQRGRLREFTQCDIDIFGVKSPLADAEIVLITYTALKNLGFKEFVINLNSRQILFEILEKAGITDLKAKLAILQSIDKLDKKSKDRVEEELAQKEFSPTQIKQIFAGFQRAQPNQELKQIFAFLKTNKVPPSFYQFNPFLARGLDYYTRTIFETRVILPKIGSIAGGGRYDNLVAKLGGPDLTGTGTSFGLERIIEAIQENNLLPSPPPSKTKVLVTIFSPQLKNKSARLAKKLRKAGIPTELYLDPQARLDKQLKYADRKKIPFVVILGPDEAKKKKVTLKELKTKTQDTILISQLLKILSSQSVQNKL